MTELAGVFAFIAVCGAAMAVLLVAMVWGLKRNFQEGAIFRDFGKQHGLEYDHISAKFTGALPGGSGTFTCLVGHPPLDEGSDSSFRRITWTAYVPGLDSGKDRFSLEPRVMPQPISKSPLSDFGLEDVTPQPTGFDSLDRGFVFRCGTDALAGRLLTPEVAATLDAQTRLRAALRDDGWLTVQIIDVPVSDNRYLPAAEIDTVLKLGALLVGSFCFSIFEANTNSAART